MLELLDIKKEYKTQDTVVQALKGLNISFRQSEFVSILGQSGCGKTTLLNIIGGLDKYTSGDLIIDGVSTKGYTDKDWDTYRNRKIGFVFQSYNLIPHLNVLENVELALTLSGIGKEVRRQKAKEVLIKVGLGDKLKSKPNQLSGGQMQRVAIARALVNDPEIILADEPTGALDSKTSVQVMDLLKEISNEKLIIMVTHNPELSQKYSSRIIRLLDGNVVDDSNPYSKESENLQKQDSIFIDEKRKNKSKSKIKTSMSLFTALSLSFKNLLTKKARTFLVSFAGSIGIIGIALILALSSGFQAYVDSVQKDTLSSYPVKLSNSNYDLSSLIQIFFNSETGTKNNGDKVYSKDELTSMLNKFNSSSSQNDLKSFRGYIEGEGKDELSKYSTAVQYTYNVNINAYYESAENGLIKVNDSDVFSNVIARYPYTHTFENMDEQTRYGLLQYMFGQSNTFYSNAFWSEMIDNQELLSSQYELVGNDSKWATQYNEVMIVLDENSCLTDYTLFGLGLLDQSKLENLLENYIKDRDAESISQTFEFEDLLNMTYNIILEPDFYEVQVDGSYKDIRDETPIDIVKVQNLCDTKGVEIKVVGIARKKADVVSSISTPIAYTSKLTQYIINNIRGNSIIEAQLADEDINVLTNKPFTDAENPKGQLNSSQVLSKLGYTSLDNPESILIYPINFESKAKIEQFISNYNAKVLASGEDSKIITYSDTVGSMMNSISTIITAISYVLIAFVSISLIVSSIMIGIITYISVLERIKEIGVLRSIGASKRDIRRVFVSESVIIGFIAGLLGILITLVLTIPINIIISILADLTGVASLPIVGAIFLILISVILTFVAGIIPARIASKKDPVIALRAE